MNEKERKIQQLESWVIIEGHFHHIVMIGDNSDCEIYVDGKLKIWKDEYEGYIGDVKSWPREAKWTQDFTPPTESYERERTENTAT